jgi:putative endonuclease
MYFVYILECKDKTLYTGITTDVERRLKEHKSGVGARYTKSRGVRKLLYTESCKSRGPALKRENEIKKWTKAKKLALITTERER